MPKPKPENENYDFLSEEYIAYAIANQQLTDIGELLHTECCLAAKLGLKFKFPMRFEDCFSA